MNPTRLMLLSRQHDAYHRPDPVLRMPASPSTIELEHDCHRALAMHFVLKTRMGRACIRFCGRDVAVSESWCGVLHAARRFDISRGTRFATYAAHWCRLYMRLAIKNEIRARWLQVVSVGSADPDVPSDGTVWHDPEDHRPSVEDVFDQGVDSDLALVAQSWLLDQGRDGELCLWRWRDGLTLEECGARVGLTRERARQIEDKLRRRLERSVGVVLRRNLPRDLAFAPDGPALLPDRSSATVLRPRRSSRPSRMQRVQAPSA